jgi:hypothetical protein
MKLPFSGASHMQGTPGWAHHSEAGALQTGFGIFRIPFPGLLIHTHKWAYFLFHAKGDIHGFRNNKNSVHQKKPFVKGAGEKRGPAGGTVGDIPGRTGPPRSAF